MTTTADLIATAKHLLLSGQRPTLNKLAANTAPGAGTLAFANEVTGIRADAYLQVGLEVFYVWTVDVAGRTATVEPAQEGSTAAAHDTGDVVTVNPRFPDHTILAGLNDCIRSLSSPSLGLYQVGTVDLSYVATAGGYDLTGVTDLLDIVDIRLHRGSATSKDWPRIDGWDLSRGVNTTDFPSGLALFLSAYGEVGSDIRVRYRSGFSALTTLATDVTTTGLPVTALDIPPLGAAIRLVHPREIKRNQTEAQGDGRRAGEVGPGSVAGSVNALERDYYRRISEEAARLAASNPPQGYVPVPGPYAVSRPYARNGAWDVTP